MIAIKIENKKQNNKKVTKEIYSGLANYSIKDSNLIIKKDKRL